MVLLIKSHLKNIYAGHGNIPCCCLGGKFINL